MANKQTYSTTFVLSGNSAHFDTIKNIHSFKSAGKVNIRIEFTPPVNSENSYPTSDALAHAFRIAVKAFKNNLPKAFQKPLIESISIKKL